MNHYRIITKCKAGFFTVTENKHNTPLDCLRSFHPGVVHTIEEKHGNNFFTVFALKGPRVFIASNDIFISSYISNYFPKTNMHSIVKPVTETKYEK